MSIKIESQKVSTRTVKPIEYKKLDKQQLEKKDYKVEEFDIKFDKKGYISSSEDKVKKRDDIEETLVINVGVGRGKTTAMQNLIKHYLSNDFIVIVAAPFKSIVQKYYNDFGCNPVVNRDQINIDGKDYDVLNYQEFDNDTPLINTYKDAHLHLMSFNCLMKNSGSTALEQKVNKSRYLSELREKVKKNDEKLVLVFDEIHESVQNFSSTYLFHLHKWKEVTHKAFILSATFTEPSILASQLISYLTNDHITICNVDRQKFKDQANLTLAVVGDDQYSKLSLSEEVVGYIKEKVKGNSDFNVLSYSKGLAKEIHKELGEDVVLTIGDNDKDFTSNKCNVGTTFKTGVNIETPYSYFIIAPMFADNFHDFKRTGIFYDGIPSIIQAVARMRDAGDIYVILPKPKKFIGGDYGVKQGEYLYDELQQPKQPNEPLGKQLDYITDSYDKRKKEIEDEIKAYNTYSQGTDKPQINFPTLDEFILDSGQELLVTRYEKYGKFINPYIVWAAYNNQFTNCTLKYFDIIKEDVESINLTEANLSKFFEASAKQLVLDSPQSNVLDLYGQLIENLEEQGGKRVQIWMNNQPILISKLLTNYNGTKLALQHLVNSKGGSVDYVKDKMQLVSDLFNHRFKNESGNPDLDNCYKVVGNKIQIINDEIAKGNIHFSKDYLLHLDPKFYEDLRPNLKEIYKLERENNINLMFVKQTDFSTDRMVYDFIKGLFINNGKSKFTKKYGAFKEKASVKLEVRNVSVF